MTIVMGFDQHREQISWDALDTSTGELRRGRIRPAERGTFRHFLGRFEGERIEAALEATTGWRFVVEELRAADAEVQLAEPAETKVLRGPKRRAKTDRADARHLRELLQQGRVPESWIPPEQILELRSLASERRGQRKWARPRPSRDGARIERRLTAVLPRSAVSSMGLVPRGTSIVSAARCPIGSSPARRRGRW